VGLTAGDFSRTIRLVSALHADVALRTTLPVVIALVHSTGLGYVITAVTIKATKLVAPTAALSRNPAAAILGIGGTTTNEVSFTDLGAVSFRVWANPVQRLISQISMAADRYKKGRK